MENAVEIVCKTRTGTVENADTRARRVRTAEDNCEIPVENLWIFQTRQALNKQFESFFCALATDPTRLEKEIARRRAFQFEKARRAILPMVDRS